MKKLIFIIATLLLCGLSYSQIKVQDFEYKLIGEHKILGTSIAKLMEIEGKYTFVYLDDSFYNIKVYKGFVFMKEDADTLFKLFSEVEDKELGSQKIVRLEDGGTLYIKYTRLLGHRFAAITHIDANGIKGKLPILNKNPLKRIFNK